MIIQMIMNMLTVGDETVMDMTLHNDNKNKSDKG